MVESPGQFQFQAVEGANGVPQVNWTLLSADGDIMAVSLHSASGTAARAAVQWIIDHAAECKVVEKARSVRG